MPRHGCCRVSLRPGLGVPNKTALPSILSFTMKESFTMGYRSFSNGSSRRPPRYSCCWKNRWINWRATASPFWCLNDSIRDVESRGVWRNVLSNPQVDLVSIKYRFLFHSCSVCHRNNMRNEGWSEMKQLKSFRGSHWSFPRRHRCTKLHKCDCWAMEIRCTKILDCGSNSDYVKFTLLHLKEILSKGF